MANVGDATRIRHMWEYATTAAKLSQGRKRADLDTDRMFVLAMVRALEVVGEAASRVSPSARQRYSQLPWSKIIGMRNRLIHEYDQVDLEVLWQTLAQEIGPLIAELEKILATQP